MRGRAVLVGTAIAILLVPLTGSAIPAPGLLLPNLSGQPGIFWSECGFSHRLADDPIVAPKKPGASHSHDFFGNRSTNASSTYSSLRGSSTLCRRPLDTAAYWVPTLSQAGKKLTPMGLTAYYLQGRKDPGSIRAFPPGLQVIAGDGTAKKPQSTRVASWSCSGSPKRSSEPPLCEPGHYLRMHVTFPDCWDGKHLDFPDHRSHMAYADGGCPSGYPVAVPRLSLAITYPTIGGPGITLASGSRYTAHADFVNAWDQAELQRLVKQCLNASRRCGQN